MNSVANELPLRDIHLPDPVSWWPPAPGWWAMLFLFVMIAYLLFCFWRYWNVQRKSPVRLALLRLQALKSDFNSHQNKQALLIKLSELIRQTTIASSDKNLLQVYMALRGWNIWIKVLMNRLFLMVLGSVYW